TGQITSDNLFSLDSLRCIGACGLAPVMMIDGEVHGRLNEPEEIKQVLDKYRP
ncbi:MAG: NAD(P)H-dependent oxidoreductase subunit E, partial [Bacillota bacterium]|nr:NAD(P)H-dependent oxidoreductase subunit E [Bacillota bacterium]